MAYLQCLKVRIYMGLLYYDMLQHTLQYLQ